MGFLIVFLGGGLGAALRHGINLLSARTLGTEFPYGTLIINVTGSLVIGIFAALTGPDGRVFASSTVRQFVMIGICGGYTTFSSFSLQTLNLVNDGEWFRAGANIVLSVLLCLIAVWGGVILANVFNAMR